MKELRFTDNDYLRRISATLDRLERLLDGKDPHCIGRASITLNADGTVTENVEPLERLEQQIDELPARVVEAISKAIERNAFSDIVKPN